MKPLNWTAALAVAALMFTGVACSSTQPTKDKGACCGTCTTACCSSGSCCCAGGECTPGSCTTCDCCCSGKAKSDDAM